MLCFSLPVIGQIGFTQKGNASYYSNKFHGKRTASGEKYDKKKLTAAHRELPFNTLVKVENLKNGKSVVVRINDRGPHRANRIIDLSLAAAQALQFIGQGTTLIKLEVIGKAPAPTDEPNNSAKSKPAAPAPKPEVPFLDKIAKAKPGIYDQNGKSLQVNSWGIQLGYFKEADKAAELVKRVAALGYSRVYIQISDQKSYRVMLGTYPSKLTANENLNEIRKKGFDGFACQYLIIQKK
jgi:rare lipoprotein A